ncbi:DUF6233 domain-containing protein [Streptomyces sp. NPDC013457]|uniref:DUF6233 domain-containing protein n=1 Tax=Streptomyces sp. NPDC013457 TaxID=3364866 RepID=UPI0036F6A051
MGRDAGLGTRGRRPRTGGRIAGTVVHMWDCPLAGKPREELNIGQALDTLERPGARACQECRAAEALLPLLGGGDG